MKALVTGGGAVLGQGIINSLRRSALDATIVVTDPNPLSAGLYWGACAYRVPPADDPAYIDAISGLLEREMPDVVLVGTDVELAAFARHRSALETRFGTRIIVSAPDVIAIADDKYRTFEFLRAHGFDPPGSARADDDDAVEALIEQVGFPLVVKPRIGARSVGVSVVHDRDQLAGALNGRSGLIVQECIGTPDGEYTASVLVFDGVPCASIVMRRDLRDGNTFRAYSGPYPALNEEVRRLGAALNPYGPANFQFRTDKSGKPRVFEINARFSGATPLRALVGFNEVEMCIRRILRDEPVATSEIPEAIILRHLSETLVMPEALEQVR
ncbi:carbamoyl phosphate synthase [Sphingomonas deserti]|uniref:Carbamoyl phosphate synthase n=1 Tax=Allosphingosinicella deserti TaxID=2116704 RepID=A0A2P7QEN0_9SPHN|nr:carbamoyl phosphate synthase [Sphingomonas deserti]